MSAAPAPPALVASLAPALALGAATGARSMVPAALLARALAHPDAVVPPHGPARWLARPAVARSLLALAAGELVGDKLPTTPDRIAPGPIAGRLALGALVGAAAAQRADRPAAAGALVGAVAAVAGAHAGFHLRRALVRRGLPDFVVALAEDAAVLLAARAAVRAADDPARQPRITRMRPDRSGAP